jgi:hypothetical protein
MTPPLGSGESGMGAASAKEKASVVAQVAALPGKSSAELKAMWRELFDAEAPIQNNRQYLVNRLAYRIQELAYGGIRPAVRARLDAMADALDPKAPKQRTERPVVGTQLIREWKGVEQRVTVVAGGFDWQGRRFKSLSAVARAITGTQWNGPAFFGLRSGKQ